MAGQALSSNFLYFLSYLLQFLKVWWWVFLPFILWKPFVFMWLFWRNEEWLKKQKRILLEIKIPKEVLKPIRAMETVMVGLWQSLYSPPNWYEKWIEGQVLLSVQFEVASIGGDPHFYVRTVERTRDYVEANIYSQYPEAEIILVDDYTKNVPQDIPNKDWDMWGSDYKLLREDAYPILTYKKFETEQEALEKKRIDPVAGLLESMAKIKPGEQLWVQIAATPISEPKENPSYAKFLEEGKALRDKLAKRPEKEKPRSMIQDAADILILGKPPGEGEKEKERDIIPPEMKLTPGEKEVVFGIEQKIARPVFSVNARFIYLGKKEVFFKPNFRLGFNFFAYFTTVDANALVPMGQTITKIKQNWYDFFWFYSRRLYLRKRKIFRNYKDRFSPFFPRSGGTYMLNSEEMASLFHFPSWEVAPVPGVSRVESKKGAPPSLPME